MVEKTSSQTITDLRTFGESNISSFHLSISNSLYQTLLLIEQALEKYNVDIQKWGSLKEEAGQYTYLINLASILFGIHSDPNAILNLEPSIVTRVAEKIHMYITRKWPEAKYKAPEVIANQELAITSWYEINLSSISSMLVSALREKEVFK
jgi:hypothetical protein